MATMTQELDAADGSRRPGGWYFLLAALLVGAPLPFNAAVAVLSGSPRDGIEYSLRWSAFYFLYWAPLGFYLNYARAAAWRRVLTGYIASLPLYWVCLWLIYPTAGGTSARFGREFGRSTFR